jgi:hypothetical protein
VLNQLTVETISQRYCEEGLCRMDMGVVSKAEILRADDAQTAKEFVPVSAPAVPEKHPCPPAAVQPTQHAPRGILYDFNEGARVLLPPRAEGLWRVRLRDLDTENILFEVRNKGAFVTSSKRYYIRFGIEVWDVDGSGMETQVLGHEYDARGRDILIQLPVGTLGDSLGWFPYVPRFAALHGARVSAPCRT